MFLDASSDVRSFVSQLVAAERAPKDAVLKNQKAYFQKRLDAYKAISSKVQSFQQALVKLKKADSFAAYKATTSSEGFAQVTTNASAAPGVYQIHVNRLATAHQVALDFGSETWALPTSGSLDLSLGGEDFSIDFSSLPAGATLVDLRGAINNAADNPGVKASLVRTGSSVRLLLTSEETGAANTIGIGTTAGAADPQFTALEAAVAGKVELSAAQDAEITLGSASPLTITSKSNKLENVIDGMTITLTKAHTDPAEQLQITIARDEEAMEAQLKTFIDEYNGLVDLLKKYTTSSADGTAALLQGDSTGRVLQQQLREQFNDLTGDLSLGMLGIKTDRYGKLSLDDDKLDKFLTANPDGLSKVFSGSGGLADKLDALLKPYVTGANAVLKTRSNSMQSGLDRVVDRQTQLDTRMEQSYNRYLSQFTRMQNLVSQMQQTSGMFG